MIPRAPADRRGKDPYSGKPTVIQLRKDVLYEKDFVFILR